MKKGDGIIVLGVIICLIAYPLLIFIFGSDSILGALLMSILIQALILFGLSVIVAGVLKRKFKDKMRWYYILITIFATWIVLEAVAGLFIVFLYGLPLFLFIKTYFYWYLISGLIIIIVLYLFWK